MGLRAGRRHALDGQACWLAFQGSGRALHFRGVVVTRAPQCFPLMLSVHVPQPCFGGSDPERSCRRLSASGVSNRWASHRGKQMEQVRLPVGRQSVAQWPREQVERAGRISERSCCKLQEFCRHLRRLDDSGWIVGDSAIAGQWTEALRKSALRLTASDIILLEARAAVKAMRRIAVSRHGWHTRQLFLGDNMCLVFVQVRRFHGYSHACWIHPSIRAQRFRC